MSDRQLLTPVTRSDAGVSRPDRYKPLMPRIMDRTKQDANGCWVWQGYIAKRGYASIWWQGRQWLAHRAVYTQLVGEIPDHLEIDHLCENKACCNPHHLEAVTRAVNMARSMNVVTALNALKTHCKRGHEFTPENTDYRPQSQGRAGVARMCIACREERKVRERKRAA